ncbi:MAG TPA: type II toxin-antitoxin system RelE/ParE family toxin [Alphaproteobacteria bacterium]|nr:type II toxin-antitoxin system RelE/ParE family toxin [Alphaproteobacteria bacterium]
MRVRYTPAAFAELKEIISYINNHHPQGARNVHACIKSTIDMLKDFPLSGTLTDDDTPIRRSVVFPYPYLISTKRLKK